MAGPWRGGRRAAHRAVGRRAYVTADAFDGVQFWGRVERVGQVLGKKKVRTDQPAERVDTKILEVLVLLDDGHELPLGLRVQAFIVGSEALLAAAELTEVGSVEPLDCPACRRSADRFRRRGRRTEPEGRGGFVCW